MDSHPIENLMRSTMENLKNMIDVDTIVGSPVKSEDGTIIIPLSKVSFGFASGGTEFSSTDKAKLDDKYPFGGGSGAGVSVKPVAFLIVKNDSVRTISVGSENTYDKIVDTVPQILDMIKGIMGKDELHHDDKAVQKDNCCKDEKRTKEKVEVKEDHEKPHKKAKDHIDEDDDNILLYD